MILQFAALTATFWGLSRWLPQFHIKSTRTVLFVTLVFTLLNWGLGWLLRALLFLPALLTLGLLFLFIPFLVNTALLWLTDKLIGDFELKDGRTLLISSGAITLVIGLIRFFSRHTF
jgi:uncharacterized membrane protein YvlD (DUF360 family)